MKHFLIYTNRYKDPNQATAKRVCGYLERNGQRTTVKAVGDEEKGKSRLDASEDVSEDIPPDADCIIVLGGDGTVLQAARDTKKLHIPIIGVNLGTLGYMTEIESENLEESLEKLIAGKYEQESRMMLNGRAYFQDGSFQEGWALNDIVISRSGSLQIIKFNIYVNGQFLNNYNADGMIVTTPTGSTGYNLSAGGPLVEPRAKLIVLTPICPHSLNQRSIILSPEDRIEIEIPEYRTDGVQTIEANFDGRHVIPLRTGDRLCIARSEKTTEFIKLDQVSFLSVLNKKMRE